ncbi:MAG: hypothetical protein JWR26_1352 [Pedosphaera sp.]|nr:hypothetical protein [Pedosphaera sp.]
MLFPISRDGLTCCAAMNRIENPALKEFVARLGDELVMAQVLVRRKGAGYELRQVEDRDVAEDSLRVVKLNEARGLAQCTAAGEFRPLKSAPTLQRGWRVLPANDNELELALNQLYPGALADWHAARKANPPVTNYREFTNRQSGMFRITTMLSDEQAGLVIKVVCSKARCLKRRMWSVAGLETDAAAEKSIIPCLEPCAVLMEAARQAVRKEQQEKQNEASPETRVKVKAD